MRRALVAPLLLSIGFGSLLGCAGGPRISTDSPPATSRIEMQWNETQDQLVIRSKDGPISTLRLDRTRPCLFPIHSPAGSMVLRRHPIEAAGSGEQQDHPHHAGSWIAHGSIDGHDFWHGEETQQIPRDWSSFLLDDGKILLASGKLDWMAGDQKVLEEIRTYDFRVEDRLHRIEIWSLWKPGGEESVRIGDTKEGTFALRLTPTLRIDGPVAAGHGFNSNGQTGSQIWGKRARWVAYSGPVDGQQVTVAFLDHEDNPRHPTWWHARTYGLFAANPFGQHDFEKKPAGAGDLLIGPGEDLFFRHQLLIFDGSVSAERIEQEWIRFSSR
ncbi:MAG: PmoA family protein [Planctomycetota bacterium]|nr:PmoA family protein [Planctomycetota bacterium]